MRDALLYQHTFDPQALFDRYPPRFQHPYKKLVARQICPDSAVHKGTIELTRWRAVPLPEHVPETPLPMVEIRPDFFTYNANETAAWHLNFAHQDLFCAYGGPLLAQDELQVLEHPALGALREALLAQKISPFTIEGETPPPILIQNVERRCRLDTTALYGNRFARATPQAVLEALTLLSPPTRSNILAMEAPPGGYGAYSLRELTFILNTAYTGFVAACHLTGPTTTIHTGFWGCGAYGGNRTVMTLLQMLAARLAGVPTLVFHTGDAPSTSTVALAQATLDRALAPTLDETLSALCREDFHWGTSDGN